MARYELLNNVAHKDLRVITRFGPEFGDAVGAVPAFPTEYAELQREYPIFLQKDPDSGEYRSIALLGLERDENLFLRDGRWSAAYLPGHVAKGPFLIGFQEQLVDGGQRREPVVHVDLDHPRVSFSEGEQVFLPGGGHSPYLQRIATVLRGIHDGVAGSHAMFSALDAKGLIQPMDLEVKLNEEVGVNLTGLHGVDRERLEGLDAGSLHELHGAGFLEGAYLMLASLHNMRHLMAEKQRRLRDAAEAPGARTAPAAP